MRCDLIVFAHAGGGVDDDVGDALDAIFAHVGGDVGGALDAIFVHVGGGVGGDVIGRRVRGAFDVELGSNKGGRFVGIVSMLVMANRVEGDFVDNVEGVSMLAMANKDILGADDKIEGVSMLVMANKSYLELVLARAIRKIFFM